MCQNQHACFSTSPIQAPVLGAWSVFVPTPIAASLQVFSLHTVWVERSL